MLGKPSRREFFVGALHGRNDAVRPPWSRHGSVFLEGCTACGDCISACPEKIVFAGAGGLPEIDFAKGGCTLCAACVESCPDGEKLFFGRDRRPWSVRPSFAESCLSSRGISCRVCGEWCEHRAIRFRLEVGGRAHPELSASACTGCGGCVSACPVGAIEMENPE